MKKLTTIIVFLLLALITLGQKTDSVTYNQHLYRVGDTITLLSGSGVNGEFISTTVVMQAVAGMTTKLMSSASGTKSIIKKIKVTQSGKLNEKIYLYFDTYVGNTIMDLKLAIIKEEILFE
jgi:hypothetical protein